MSTDPDDQPQHERLERLPEPGADSGIPKTAERAAPPEAVQAEKVQAGEVRAATVARHGEKQPPLDVGRRARGVEWVRPTELIARHGAALAGRGIDLEVELARRGRAPMTAGVRHLSDRAHRLPPLSAFGRSSPAQGGPSRPGARIS